MIGIRRHVHHVALSFQAAKIVSSRPNVNDSGPFLHLNMPVDLPYNEHWTVAHGCDCGNESVSFSRAPQRSWHFINRLWTGFYRYGLLVELQNAFDTLHVIAPETSEYAFLTTVDFRDESVPVHAIPKVQFNHYRCRRCQRQYVCRFSEGLPLSPDRSMPNGRDGRLLLKEIVEIELEDGSDFAAFVRSFSHYWRSVQDDIE